MLVDALIMHKFRDDLARSLNGSHFLLLLLVIIEHTQGLAPFEVLILTFSAKQKNTTWSVEASLFCHVKHYYSRAQVSKVM